MKSHFGERGCQKLRSYFDQNWCNLFQINLVFVGVGSSQKNHENWEILQSLCVGEKGLVTGTVNKLPSMTFCCKINLWGSGVEAEKP